MASDIVKRSGWVDLCPDLLDVIAKHIRSSLDYVSFRAACKSWNAALPKISRHIRGPWLVLPFDDKTLKIEKKEPYHLRVPELHDTPIRGSCFGWLITVGTDGELRILNPFTSSHFLLPPLSTFPGVVSYQPDNYGHEYTIGRHCSIHTVDKIHMQRDFIAKIILSSSPEQEDFMAVAIYGECPPHLAFYRSGDDKWTDVDFPSSPGGFGFQDVIFHQGKIYAVDRNEYFYEIDTKTLACGVGNVRQPRYINQMRKIYKIKYPDGRLLTECDDVLHHKYLVRTPDGHLLMVVRRFCHYFGVNHCHYKTTRFHIFKLDESRKRWNKEFRLGDYVLAIGYNSSICVPPFKDEEGSYVSNCIYYTDNLPRRELYQGHYFRGQDIGVFSLKDGSFSRLFPRSNFSRSPVWL